MTFNNWIETIKTPKRETKELYQAYVLRCLKKYRDKIRRLSKLTDGPGKEIFENRNKIFNLTYRTNESITEYLKGNNLKAINKFKEGINEVNEHLNWLILNAVPDQPIDWMFRVRVADSLKKYGPEDLFHVPFSIRHKITTKRYSIPGVPSLYTGSTSYVCWEELGRPNLSNLVVMGLKPVNELRILNLAFNPRALTKAAKEIDFEKESYGAMYWTQYLYCLPIQIACSVPALFADSPFIEEYIIPQMLLDWVRGKDNCDGIMYYSCHLSESSGPKIGTNYVFPVKTISSTGFCPSLKSKFETAGPIALDLIDRHGVVMRSRPITGKVEFFKGQEISYIGTRFYELDSIIMAMDRKKL